MAVAVEARILERRLKPAVSSTMEALAFLILLAGVGLGTLAGQANAEDPTVTYEWTVAYKIVSPLGVAQKVIAINDRFPGPILNATTNNNVVINVRNNLDEPLLFSFQGIQQRRDSWQDGVSGTNCPILPGKQWTYNMQFKDQIGTFFYAPSLLLQKAAGGFGGVQVYNRPVISVPFPPPEGDITLLIGDWYKTGHTVLRNILEKGSLLPPPDAILINGRGPAGSGQHTIVDVNPGKTYRFRVSNVGTSTTFNFAVQSHKFVLVEVEGSYTQQTTYTNLDVHAGQSYSILITTDQGAGDFYIVATSRFVTPTIEGVAVLHYTNSKTKPSGAFPPSPDPLDIDSSIAQAKTIKWNLTTGAARPNPQGSYHYGQIKISQTVIVANSAPVMSGKQRYAVNGVSYLAPTTPLKLADYFKITGVFELNSIPFTPGNQGTPAISGTSVMVGDYRSFIEFVLQNGEDTIQSWHFDGYSFFVVAFGSGDWSLKARDSYNLVDAVSRSTTQVYPKGYTVVLVAMDNVGMWNFRSAQLQRAYLGQEFYIRVYDPAESLRTEKAIPANVLLCGKAARR